VVILNLTRVVGGARGFTSIPALAGFLGLFVRRRDRPHRASHGAVLQSLAFLRSARTLAAGGHGHRWTRYKVTAFLVGSFFAGIAGGLFAHFVPICTQFLHVHALDQIIVMVCSAAWGASAARSHPRHCDGFTGSAARRRRIPHGDLFRDADRVTTGEYSVTARSTCDRCSTD
jgi:hypothetical protein